MVLPPALTPGTVIGGHYIINNLINSGGFGAIYRGVDTSEGNRLCAIKETYDVTPAARRQALMEASVLFTVRSKHLPEVYDALEANGRFYLVMQLVEGQDLLQLLRSRVPNGLVGEQEPYQQSQGPCSEQEVLGWLLPIMDVLQDLHSRNPPIMHRDIKPGNIILTPQQTTVLVDFGLTRLYDPQTNTQTLVKAVSAGFSPIEQYTGKTSPQSDIYSMAATIYLLLTNRLPPTALYRSTQDTLIAPRLLNPAISPRVEQALLKALAVHADQRYHSMREFAQALQPGSFRAHSDPTIAATSMSRPLASPPKATPPLPSPYTPKPTSPIRPPGGAIGSGHPTYPPPPYPHGYTMAPQVIFVPQQALPTPFGQGCLWGLLQGLLAGALVAFNQTTNYFYLAVLLGFLTYLFAGFMTTRKGGATVRGGWAGFWAGFHSTIIFWLVYGLGYLLLLSQNITRLSKELPSGTSPNTVLKEAQAAIHTALPSVSTNASSQSSGTNILVILIVGATVAFLLGLVGGRLGMTRYKEKLTKMSQRPK